MDISLTPTLRRFVAEQVESGRYLDASEVVGAALGLMGAEGPRVAGLEPGAGDGGDIMALAFLVLMDASNSAQDDLKAIMEGVKASNAAKRALRQLIDRANEVIEHDAGGNDRVDVRQVVHDDLQSALDSLNEMDDMESMRLQMAMDRVSKLMSMLANMLKKNSDTASTLVQNLK